MSSALGARPGFWAEGQETGDEYRLWMKANWSESSSTPKAIFTTMNWEK